MGLVGAGHQNSCPPDPPPPRCRCLRHGCHSRRRLLQGCRSVEEFQCLNRIEEGTYGVVYRAKDKKTGGEALAWPQGEGETGRDGVA